MDFVFMCFMGDANEFFLYFPPPPCAPVPLIYTNQKDYSYKLECVREYSNILDASLTTRMNKYYKI